MSGRLDLARALDWDPRSLLGSWFLADRTIGCVVAEALPGVYLVELLEDAAHPADPPLSAGQRIVSVDEMAAWEFYDDEATAYDRRGAAREAAMAAPPRAGAVFGPDLARGDRIRVPVEGGTTTVTVDEVFAVEGEGHEVRTRSGRRFAIPAGEAVERMPR